MNKVKNIEWGNRAKQEGNILYIDRNDVSDVITNEFRTSDAITPRKPKAQDGTNIYDPHILSKISGFYLHNRTLTEGEIEMSDNKDWRYAELKEDLRESERRISDDVKEREERFEKSITRFSQEAKEREERFMKNIEEIKEIVLEGEKSRKSTSIAIWTLAITTIIGIAAMVVTVVLSV